MTITYRGAVVRNIKSNSYYGYDIDATNYIRSVESADGQALETGVKDAINTFIVGCKTDGIWDAIKASCILAGARTLDGALVPLVGAAPTNNNFVSGDYNRETGLIGDDSTKYLNSNRNNNADPQDDNHQVVFLTKEQTVTAKFYIGAGTTNPGTSHIGRSTFLITRSRSSTDKAGTPPDAVGLLGISRNNSTTFTLRADGTSSVVSDSSQTPYDNDVLVFSVSNSTLYSNARIAFYSIGESLDLALLDTRVTSLMAQLAFAINTGLSPVGYSSETIDYVNAGYAAGGTLA